MNEKCFFILLNHLWNRGYKNLHQNYYSIFVANSNNVVFFILTLFHQSGNKHKILALGQKKVSMNRDFLIFL